MSFVCTHCAAALSDASVDRAREIATCGACGRLVDLRHPAARAAAAPDAPAKPRLRPAVGLPAGMAIRAEEPGDGLYRAGATPSAIVIERRWLRGKHYFLLAIFVGASAAAASLWMQHGFSVALLIGTIFLASWNFQLLSMFVNRTVIRGGKASIDVRHGPLPSAFYRPQSVPSASVSQLFATAQASRFAVKAKLTDGTEKTLVWPLITAEQALFVEQQLERALGLVDFEVPGELGSSLPAAIAAPGGKAASSGGAGVALLVPLLIGGSLLLFFFMAASEVTGAFTANAEAGGWTFTPDDCSSGQLSGFLGVDLTSEAEPGRVIRLTRDPVRGNLLIVDSPGAGRPNEVIDAAMCEQLDLSVTRTNTSINDVWVVEGWAKVKCKSLSGQVTFAGCH